MDATHYWPFAREYSLGNVEVAALQFWVADLVPQTFSIAIKWVLHNLPLLELCPAVKKYPLLYVEHHAYITFQQVKFVFWSCHTTHTLSSATQQPQHCALPLTFDDDDSSSIDTSPLPDRT